MQYMQDPNRDITLNCSDCLAGFQLQSNPKKPCVPTCQNQDCACDNPGECTSCKDSNADPDAQCQVCLEGYYYKNEEDAKCSKKKSPAKPASKNTTSTPNNDTTDDDTDQTDADTSSKKTTNDSKKGKKAADANTSTKDRKSPKKPAKKPADDTDDADEPDNDN